MVSTGPKPSTGANPPPPHSPPTAPPPAPAPPPPLPGPRGPPPLSGRRPTQPPVFNPNDPLVRVFKTHPPALLRPTGPSEPGSAERFPYPPPADEAENDPGARARRR